MNIFIKNKEKKYFKQKLEGVQKMLWDMEFKIQKTRMIREEIRQEYDNLKSKLNVLEAQLKSQSETPILKKEVAPENPISENKVVLTAEQEKEETVRLKAKEELARLEDNKVILDKEIEKKIEQMKALDIEINGSKQTNEYPEGVQGITQYIDNLQELKLMLKEYIKKL